MRAFVTFLIRLFPWLSADYRRQVSPKDKCPACGVVTVHGIRWSPAQKAVVLTCARCKARWGYDPVIKTQKWLRNVEE